MSPRVPSLAQIESGVNMPVVIMPIVIVSLGEPSPNDDVSGLGSGR